MKETIEERVLEVRKMCNIIENQLKVRYTILNDAGASNEVLDEINNYINEIKKIFEEADLNIDRSEKKLELYSRILKDKYQIFRELNEDNSINHISENVDEKIALLKNKKKLLMLCSSIFTVATAVWIVEHQALFAALFGANWGLCVKHYLDCNLEMEDLKDSERKLIRK